MGRNGIEDDSEHARAYAGALMIAEGIHELRLIRKLLTPRE